MYVIAEGSVEVRDCSQLVDLDRYLRTELSYNLHGCDLT
jgi:hypothetical protein